MRRIRSKSSSARAAGVAALLLAFCANASARADDCPTGFRSRFSAWLDRVGARPVGYLALRAVGLRPQVLYIGGRPQAPASERLRESFAAVPEGARVAFEWTQKTEGAPPALRLGFGRVTGSWGAVAWIEGPPGSVRYENVVPGSVRVLDGLDASVTRAYFESAPNGTEVTLRTRDGSVLLGAVHRLDERGVTLAAYEPASRAFIGLWELGFDEIVPDSIRERNPMLDWPVFETDARR